MVADLVKNNLVALQSGNTATISEDDLIEYKKRKLVNKM